MILTNNIRDLEKDKLFRNTLAGMLGRKLAVYTLVGLLAFAYLSIATLVFLKIIPWQSFIFIFASPAVFRLIWSFRGEATRREEMAGMKWASYHHWAFGVLFAAGVWLFG